MAFSIWMCDPMCPDGPHGNVRGLRNDNHVCRYSRVGLSPDSSPLHCRGFMAGTTGGLHRGINPGEPQTSEGTN
jgi:hypothetical protein